jgi:pimeloyl-ACP methyl ester carboxylesterase
MSGPTVETVDLPHGQVSLARMGTGPPVVLLHQTPRSWDEYRDVLPRLAEAGHAAIAFDTPGFGGSAPVPGEPTIAAWASVLHDALDALGRDEVAVVGHHTGGVVAVELARQRPVRVRALALSSTPLTDAEYRSAPPDESAVDVGEDAETLRASRAGFYPPDRPDLLDRYAADAVRAGPLARAGHHIVGAYQMEHAIGALTMPVLLIGATHDDFAYPQLPRLRRALPHAEVIEIEGGMVPLPDGHHDEFAAAVAGFLARAA